MSYRETFIKQRNDENHFRIMKFSAIIAEYLTFNRKEQRGIFVLATVLFVLILANAFIPVVVPQKQFDFSGFGKEISAFVTQCVKLPRLWPLARTRVGKTSLR